MADPWVSPYVPQPHQVRFHSSPAENKLLMGGVGSGKTLTGIHECIRLLQDNPESDGLIGAPTFPMLRDAILAAWFDFVHPSLYQFKRGDQQIIWKPTGRCIFLKTCGDPDRARGPTVAWFWIDEAALLLRLRVWNIFSARVRCPRARRLVKFATTSPNGLNWLVRLFNTADPAYFTVRARTADNKKLPEDYERSLRVMYGEEFAAQELDAQIIDLRGLAWPVHPKVHGRLSLAEMKARCVAFFGGMDWGFRNPSALIVGGVDRDLRWHLLDEHYVQGVERGEVAAQAKKMTEQWGVTCWWSDHDPEGISQCEKLGVPVRRAPKAAGDVEAGIQHFRSLLSVRLDGEPRVYVNQGLKHWHHENEGYKFPTSEAAEKARRTAGQDAPELPVGANGDHEMDATRYMVLGHDRSEFAAQAGGIRIEGDTHDAYFA